MLKMIVTSAGLLLAATAVPGDAAAHHKPGHATAASLAPGQMKDPGGPAKDWAPGQQGGGTQVNYECLEGRPGKSGCAPGIRKKISPN